MRIVAKHPINDAIILVLAVLGLFFAVNLVSSQTTHKSLVHVGGIPKEVITGNDFNLFKFCQDAEHVGFTTSPEAAGVARVAAKGLETVIWNDTGTNGVATHYYSIDGEQKSQTIEVKQGETSDCMRVPK